LPSLYHESIYNLTLAKPVQLPAYHSDKPDSDQHKQAIYDLANRPENEIEKYVERFFTQGVFPFPPVAIPASGEICQRTKAPPLLIYVYIVYIVYDEKSSPPIGVQSFVYIVYVMENQSTPDTKGQARSRIRPEV
jgi:hypothetical protein